VSNNKTFESLDDVREYVRNNIKMGREYIIEEASRFDHELYQVLDSSKEQYPLLVNVQSDAAKEVLYALMKGTEPNLEPMLQVLYHVELDVDDYKDLGRNDGMMSEMSAMATRLGMPEEFKRAYEAIYTI